MSNETQDYDQSENESTEEETSEETSSEDSEGTSKNYAELYENQKIRAEKAEARLKELQKEDTTSKNETKKETKSDKLDYGEKAWLAAAHGIKESTELERIQEIMSETGKDLEGVISSKYVQAELNEMREQKQADEAVPKGTNRSGQGGANSVEYWIQKGELPPKDQTKLRREVVNARMQKEKNDNKFTSHSVVS